jgi:hypothetical protein
MAILKPVVDTPQEADVIDGSAVVVDRIPFADFDTDETDAIAQDTPVAPKPVRPKQPKQKSGLLGLLHEPKPRRTRRKPAPYLENQMSLFDLLEDTA